MLNTYVVEGGVGKCATFSALIPKLKEKSEVQRSLSVISRFKYLINIRKI